MGTAGASCLLFCAVKRSGAFSEHAGWAEGSCVTSRRFHEAALRVIVSPSWGPALCHHGRSGYLLNLRRQHREAMAAGTGPDATAKHMQRTTSSATGDGLHTTIKYMRGAAFCALHVHSRGAKTDACDRSFAVLSTQVSAVGLRHA